MRELFKRNVVFKVTAVLLSILLWFYVTNLQNPTIDKTLAVPVFYLGLQEGLVTGDKPQLIDVKVKGSRSVLNPLLAKDIKATVDLAQAKTGEGNFPVQVTLPTGVELVGIKPASVQLSIDSIQEKQLGINVKIENTVAQGYSSFEPVLTPSRVVVRGPLTVLESLESASVTIDLNQASDNLVLTLPVNLLDTEGQQIQANILEISPINVQAFVPVIQNIPTKTVPVKPTLTGQPQEEWKISRVVLEPETVKITGPYDKLIAIDEIVTQPIDITGLEQNMVIQVGLSTPEGISLLYEPSVKVLIQVEEAPVNKLFEEVTVQVQNKKEGQSVVIKPEKVKLTLQGPRREISALKPERIRALVDLKDLGTGTHELELKVDIPINIQAIKTEPSTVEVTITQ